MLNRTKKQKAGEEAKFYGFGFAAQRVIGDLVSRSADVSDFFKYTETHYIGLPNFVGVTSVNAVRVAYQALTGDFENAKYWGLRTAYDVVAAEVANVIYLSVNNAYGRDITEVDPLEKAAVRTLGTGLARLAVYGAAEGLNRLGLFGCKSRQQEGLVPVDDNDLEASMLAPQTATSSGPGF
jgi:hypothetical protein